MAHRLPYHTIDASYEHEIKPVKGSRFVAYLFPIVDQMGFKQTLTELQVAHPHARHCCWAWQTPVQACSDDDGEPKNSAGKPILAQLQGAKLYDVGLVVVRYFGGTKLGVGGLIRAYSSAAGAVIQVATRIIITPKTRLSLTYRYEDSTLIKTVLAKYPNQIISSDFSTAIQIILDVDESDAQEFVAAIIEKTAGRICPKKQQN